MIHYLVSHRTSYSYREPVQISHNLAFLLPRSLPYQRVLQENLQVLPVARVMETGPDSFGNRQSYFRVEEAHHQFVVETRLEIQVDSHTPSACSGSWLETVRRARDPSHPAFLEVQPFLFPSPLVQWGTSLQQSTRTFSEMEGTVWDVAREIMGWIHHSFTFDPRSTEVGSPVELVLQQKRGVCQDYSHLMIAMLRQLGIPARYVSGYLETSPPPGKPKLLGADASHAWLQAWDHQGGWCDFDPTNDCCPDENHITLAYGRDFGDVCPLRGIIDGGGEQELRVAVDVQRMAQEEEFPRLNPGKTA